MLKGENVYLRPIELNDLNYLNAWKNDEETFKFLGGGYQPISIDQQAKWIESLIDLTGDTKRYIITTFKDDIAIGMIGLYGINWIHRTAEMGLYIGEENYRGKGYASEAYGIIENYAKKYLNLRKLNLEVVHNNNNAIKLWTRLGFSKAGKLSDERYIDGEYYDLSIMEKFINN